MFSLQALQTPLMRFTDKPSDLALVLYASRVPAGFPSPADDHLDGKLDLNLHLVRRPAATFFVRAQGDSMRDAGLFDGDLLIVDRAIAPQVLDIVIAAIDGELTVKRLKKSEGTWALSAENPEFSDIRLGEAGCEVWGVVTHSIRHHCLR